MDGTELVCSPLTKLDTQKQVTFANEASCEETSGISNHGNKNTEKKNISVSFN
jgi:hypothetical protein